MNNNIYILFFNFHKLFKLFTCKNNIKLLILGYFIETIDVCGIARLRGTKLKRFELLEEDICFNESWSGNRVSMSFDDVTRVSLSYYSI